MAANVIQRLRGARREAHARGVLGRLAPSGLSKAEFCRREGISTVTLGRWLAEFGAASPSAAGEGFVEVRLDRGLAREGFELECTGTA